MVLAAALVAVLALGITSIGGPEKVVETLKRYTLNREQVRVNSDDNIELIENVSEEEVYQEIEDKFGFLPVRMVYLPEEIEFIKAKIGDEIQGIYFTYGKEGEVKIKYLIRPNYRDGSLGKDVEDELLEEYIEENEYTTINVKRYRVEGNEERWSVQFEYKNVFYSILIMDTSKEETEKIVENLIFS